MTTLIAELDAHRARARARQRARVLERDLHMCQCDDCLRDDLMLEADQVGHIVPLSQGGTDDDDNLRAINSECRRRQSPGEGVAGKLKSSLHPDPPPKFIFTPSKLGFEK